MNLSLFDPAMFAYTFEFLNLQILRKSSAIAIMSIWEKAGGSHPIFPLEVY